MRTSKKEIFVDLDGVMADFVKDCCLAHGRDNPYEVEGYKCNRFYESENCIRKIFGMTYKEFWEPMNGVPFWENLDVLEPGRKLLSDLEDSFGKKNIFFLSTPSSHISSYVGKFKWIDKHFPNYLSKTFLAHDKHRFAHQDAILIDDKIQNCLNFNSAGGLGIAYITKWNENMFSYDGSARHYVQTISEFLSSI